jgi:hypothetical protein
MAPECHERSRRDIRFGPKTNLQHRPVSVDEKVKVRIAMRIPFCTGDIAITIPET